MARPGDPLQRQIFADWLADQGADDMAEYIRDNARCCVVIKHRDGGFQPGAYLEIARHLTFTNDSMFYVRAAMGETGIRCIYSMAKLGGTLCLVRPDSIAQVVENGLAEICYSFV
jgi:uncharacterized protein (TIGR02996 family)